MNCIAGAEMKEKTKGGYLTAGFSDYGPSFIANFRFV